MKLISLNTWGGKLYKPLISFIKQHYDTDIFCLQEVFKTKSAIKISAGYRTSLLSEISRLLKNHNEYFKSSIDNYLSGSFQKHFTDFDLSSGSAIFVNKEIKIIKQGFFSVFCEKNNFNPLDTDTMPRIAQYVILNLEGKKLIVCNLHGIWTREGKVDTISRIKQSKMIRDFLDKLAGNKILCGDFNLDIKTESIKMLEQSMRNLIKEYKIATTRNKFYPGKEKFADYIFVSSDLKVSNFKVPKVIISDHLPMILEFS